MTNNNCNYEISFYKLKQICERIEKHNIEKVKKDCLIISKNNWNKFSDIEKYLINCSYYIYTIDEKYMGNNDKDKNKVYIIPYNFFIGIKPFITRS